jgi:murein DD-endopeptidase MepM/ murein hydrolase activator NlpD
MRRIAGVIVLLAPLFLAACSTSPQTEFDWKVNDHMTRAKVKKTYVARAEPAPKSRTKAPGWYAQTARPAARDVTPVDAGPMQGTFSWPVNGRVISNFGSTANGERNDGINIAAASGEPIHAAATGTVSYTGNELRGYGNLVLIQHGDGYVTAYAHADRILVSRGDRVVKGQVIGYAGETGDVTSPQVHFEIRHGVQPVNPRPLLAVSTYHTGA